MSARLPLGRCDVWLVGRIGAISWGSKGGREEEFRYSQVRPGTDVSIGTLECMPSSTRLEVPPLLAATYHHHPPPHKPPATQTHPSTQPSLPPLPAFPPPLLKSTKFSPHPPRLPLEAQAEATTSTPNTRRNPNPLPLRTSNSTSVCAREFKHAIHCTTDASRHPHR